MVKVEKVEVNGKIVFDQEGRREAAEDVLPKDGDVEHFVYISYIKNVIS